MIVCSAAACVIQLRHDASLGAVCRYFTRSFARDANLERELASHLTTAQLEALFVHDSATNLGGFVYRHEGSLQFYPHTTRRSASRRTDQAENEELFPRLMKLYRAGDVRGLVTVLGRPSVRARLAREGFPRTDVDLLRRVDLPDDERERAQILRSLLPYLSRFAPYAGEPYLLSLREKLRFYETHRPRGEFVGTFEVLGLRLDPATDDEFGHSMASQSHYFAILRVPGDQILIKDYYGNRLRTYTVRTIEHPSGRRLFKVA